MQETALINPRPLPGDPELPRTAIVVLVEADLKLFPELVGEAWQPIKIRDYFQVHATGPDGPVVVGPAFGAPQAAVLMEKIFVLGVDRVLVLGWAGSLIQEIRAGDLVTVTGAVSDEGTSQHYPLDRTPRPDPDLTGCLNNALHASGLDPDRLHQGKIWTTDALYRETPAKIAARTKDGCVAVDMETSALLTVAAFRERSPAGLMVITDELGSGEWQPGFKTEEVAEARFKAAEIILKTARDAGIE